LIGIDPMPAGGTTAGPATGTRLTERHVLALGLAVAGVLVLAAGAAAGATLLAGGSPWTAIHLALAGAATVAIGTFMPHFAVTLAGTRPRAAVERLVAIGLLATGATTVVIGMTVVGGWLAGIGSLAMLAGLGVVAVQTLAPPRDPLARRHHVVTLTYGAALVQLAAGISIGGLSAAGLPWAVASWAELRAAHVWLALFGAVSLTIFGTLVYLAPTVLGARIRPSTVLIVGAVGMLAGPPITAVAFVVSLLPLALAGMALTLLGAFGQIGYLLDVVRRRGPFTSEHDWRRASWGHLFAGPAWFAAALVVAVVGMIGGDPLRGWSIGLLAVPMIAGWMLQELIGSWTHLAPSVTPGTAASHARQRRVLAVASRTRLVALNAGVALAWLGGALGVAPAIGAGALLIGASALVAVALLIRALVVNQSLTVARY